MAVPTRRARSAVWRPAVTGAAATRPAAPPPPPTGGGRSLVAVVPIAVVEHDFLKPLNNPSTAAWLIDQRWTAMAASRPQLVGSDMAKLSDAGLQTLARKYIMGHAAGCEVVDRPFRVGSVPSFAPAMVAAEPVTVADRRWELFVSTSLESVDGSVEPTVPPGRVVGRRRGRGRGGDPGQHGRGADPRPGAGREVAARGADPRAGAGPPDPAGVAAEGAARRGRSTWRPSTARPATSAATSTTGSSCPTGGWPSPSAT